MQKTIKIQTVEVKCLNKKARKNKILVGNSQLSNLRFTEQKEIGSVGRSVGRRCVLTRARVLLVFAEAQSGSLELLLQLPLATSIDLRWF